MSMNYPKRHVFLGGITMYVGFFYITGPLTDKEEMGQVKRKIPNTRSKTDRKIGDMLNKTRRLLSKFYSPFNKRLSKLLNDDKYLWLS
jgi:hypothetical protein